MVDLGARRVAKELWETGADRASIFVVAEGKVFFDPQAELYAQCLLKPVKGCEKDLLREFIKEAKEVGLKVAATIVCTVDPLHAKEHPEVRVRDVYGNSHGYALCPSNPALRDYLMALTKDLASNYDVEEVELDYIRFKRSRDKSLLPLHLYLARYCYCDYCKRRAEEEGINWNTLTRVVKQFMDLAKPSRENVERFTRNYIAVGDVVRLYFQQPIISQWLNVRAKIVSGLVASVKDALEEVGSGVKLSADLFYPTVSWQVGQDYSLLGRHLDTVKPMVYTPRMGAWETKYLKELLSVLGEEYEDELLTYISFLLGIDKPASLEAFELMGVPPKIAFRETAKARELLPRNVRLYTGLYSIHEEGVIENPVEKLLEATKAALRGGADGLYYFAFRRTPEPHREALRKIKKELK